MTATSRADKERLRKLGDMMEKNPPSSHLRAVAPRPAGTTMKAEPGRTARFEARQSGGYLYAVVVEDVRTDGRWKKRLVRSYGRLNPESERLARLDAAIITARKALEAVRL